MKFTKSILIALAAVAIPAASAFAVTFVDGDLILGIRATAGQGATIDYEVDLGSATNFVSGGSFATGAPVVLSLGNIAADLSSTYGANWYTSGNLVFSVSGVQRTAGNGFVTNQLFVTNAEPTPGTQSIPWNNRSVSSSSTIGGKVRALGVQFGLGTTADKDGTLAGGDQVASTNSSVAVLQPTTINQNSYANNMPGGTNGALNSGTSYNSFVGGIEGGISSTLDLYKLTPSSSGAGLNLGTLNMDSNGGVTFISPAAVPEPSTYALLASAAGIAIATRLRKKSVKL